VISLGTYRSAVSARRTKDTRLPDSQANLRARRAGPTGIGRRAGRLSAPDPLREPVPADNTSGFQWLMGGTPAMRPRPHHRGHVLVNSHGGFDRNSGPMIVQQRLLYRRSACITIHAWGEHNVRFIAAGRAFLRIALTGRDIPDVSAETPCAPCHKAPSGGCGWPGSSNQPPGRPSRRQVVAAEPAGSLDKMQNSLPSGSAGVIQPLPSGRR
jgi:hypothetical protein